MISSQPFSTINYSHYMITIWFPVVRYCNIKWSVRLPRPIEIELDILINKSQRKAISCSRPIAGENAKGWLSLAEDVPGDFSAYYEARKLKTKTIAKAMTRNSAEIVLAWMIVTKKENALFFFFARKKRFNFSTLWPAKILWLMPLFLSKSVLSFFVPLKLLPSQITAHDNTQKLIK